jgi:predicted glycosyltransferase
VEFVHDTGAASNIIKLDDAALWEDRGAEVVSMSGYNGAVEVLKGGADLTVWVEPVSDETYQEQDLKNNFD